MDELHTPWKQTVEFLEIIIVRVTFKKYPQEVTRKVIAARTKYYLLVERKSGVNLIRSIILLILP